ncbi:MAG: hypothetical protein ACOCNL_11040, partial [Acetivibrio ethanolgignens]
MKRNSLLAKSLTLGLAVATAAASMSTPGGLVVPVTAYAQEDTQNTQNTQDTPTNDSDSTADKKELTGTVKLEGTMTVGETLTVTVEGGDASSEGYEYFWYRVGIADGKELSAGDIHGAENNKYTLQVADAGCKIWVGVRHKDRSGFLDKKTDEIVALKECKISLGEAASVFGEVTEPYGKKSLAVTIPDAAKSEPVEYSVDGGKTWEDLSVASDSGKASIPLANKAYLTETIWVRVKQNNTTGTAASAPVKYAKPIRATLILGISIDNALKYGEEITAKVEFIYEEQKDAALKYQFYYVKNGQTTPIGAASSTATLKLDKADYIGAKIKVKVTAEGYDGQAELTTNATVGKADARPVADPSIESKEQKDETYTYTLTAMDGAGAKYAVVEGTYATVQEAQTAQKYIQWKNERAFDGLEANKAYTFFVTYDQQDTTHELSEIKYLNVTVDKLKHPALTLKVTVEPEGGDGDKKVTIGKVDGAEYSFEGDEADKYKGGDSDNERTFKKDEIDTNPIITVAIRYKVDERYEATASLKRTFDLRKEIQEAPNAAGVTFLLNADKTKYMLRIADPNDLNGAAAEYSLDGQTFKAKAEIEKKEFGANETIHLYVRKKETESKNASGVVLTTKTTGKASAAPTITGKDNAATFKDTLEVTLEASAGSDIY